MSVIADTKKGGRRTHPPSTAFILHWMSQSIRPGPSSQAFFAVYPEKIVKADAI